MAAGGNPANVDLGPGRLYYAPVTEPDPISCSAALPSAWIPVGYTEDGTSVETEITSEAIEVAEELDPIAYDQTSRRTRLTIQMAEATVSRLALGLGAGAGRVNDSGVFEFPDPAAIVPVKFVWDSDEVSSVANRRWVFRQCTPSGTISTARRKAPQKALIGVTFNCAKPESGPPVRVFPNASGQI